MKTFEIKKTVEIKEGKKWVESMVVTDEKEVYDNLAHDMISKKINCCQWIKSIKRIPNYNGSQTIKVTYDNDVRATYIISDH